MQIYAETDSKERCPLTVSEGRRWLELYARKRGIPPQKQDVEKKKRTPITVPLEFFSREKQPCAIVMKDVWFRYEKDSPDVVRNLSLQVKKRRILCAGRRKWYRKKYHIVFDKPCEPAVQRQDLSGWKRYPFF